MQVIITKNYEEMSKKAFDVLKAVVVENPHAVLGLATGSSPLGLYANMIKDHKQNKTSYADITTVNLDEYVGLGLKDDQSYIYFMKENLFDSIDIKAENTFLPNGMAEDMVAECARYTALLDEHQQDIQLLGIGANGHIGFNEPNSPFDGTTQIIELKEKTRKDNARFFASLEDVPTHAITMGIKNIMNAKKILVVASGLNKADAVYAMVKGEVNEICPASVLQRHKDVVVVVDELAASKL